MRVVGKGAIARAQAADVLAQIHRLASEHYTGHCRTKGCGYVTDKFDDTDCLNQVMGCHVRDDHRGGEGIGGAHLWTMVDKRGVVVGWSVMGTFQ